MNEPPVPSRKAEKSKGSIFKTAIGALGKPFRRAPIPEFPQRRSPVQSRATIAETTPKKVAQTLSKATSGPTRAYEKGLERGSFSPEAERQLRPRVGRTESTPDQARISNFEPTLSPDPSREQSSMRRAMSFAVVGGFGRKSKQPTSLASLMGNEPRGGMACQTTMPKEGTLHQFLNWVIFENLDIREFDALVLSYRSLDVTPEQMIESICRIFTALPSTFASVSPSQSTDHNRLWNQKRLIRFATAWLKNLQDEEKTPELTELVEVWVKEIDSVGESLTYEYRSLQSIIHGGSAIDTSRYRFSPEHNRSMTPTTAHLTKLSMSQQVANPKSTHSFHISHFPAALIAKQLHFIEFNLIKNIQIANEFVGMGWASKEKQHRCPHVMSMIQRFNSVAFWIATKIITVKSHKKKLGMLIHFIHVADECRRQNNFNSLMEILAGINNYNVINLTEVWKALPEKWSTTFADLETLMSSQNNYKNYRRYFARILKDDLNNSKLPPILPYLGLYLRDITFVHEGSSVFLKF
eukprot:TRINITY_DN9495_c0_g2_i2.p1 TRINITY_DN9495_c0_g2~~TRINITY_DN9495_c0_g2_i2.p1  ORF type:complete len:524 (-),score=106.06 TRINITY_DN9495_c0_g2_i2:73-1644(-)